MSGRPSGTRYDDLGISENVAKVACLVTVTNLHAPLSKNATRWLRHVANPHRARGELAPPLEPSDLADALYAAELHGILPVALLVANDAARVAFRPGDTAQCKIKSSTLNSAWQKRLHQTGFELLLKHHGERALSAVAAVGVPAIIVKGPVCARRLYTEPALRMYTDIDILIPLDTREKVSAIMRNLGFELHNPAYRASKEYFEDKWLIVDQANVNIEVHSDLVHNPQSRRAFSIVYDDVIAAGDGDPEDATALLFVVAAHGAIGHQFDRLQHLVDVALAARGAAGEIDVGRLAHVAQRCGVKTAVYAALRVAGDVLGEPACHELARRLAPTELDVMAARLINLPTVMNARSQGRSKNSWRRKLFRQAIRLGTSR